MAKAYRFHNVVGLNTDAGTVYLPAPEAAKLAKALTAAVQSIGRESFGESSVNRPDVADYSHAPDAHNVADALAAGLIRARETSPGHWRADFRKRPGGRWYPAKSDAGPIDYASPRAAYSAAVYIRSRIA